MMGQSLIAGRWTLGLVACLAGSSCGRAESKPPSGASAGSANGGEGLDPHAAGGAAAGSTGGGGMPVVPPLEEGGASGGGAAEVPTALNYAVTGAWPNRPVAYATKPGSLSYEKVVVHDRFLAESCAIGDYDGDGTPDISSGRRWYPGPAFADERVFRGGHDDLPRTGETMDETVTGVSDDQADYAWDMDGDGDVDIINVSNTDANENKTPNPAPQPQVHGTAYWYENPGAELAATSLWTPHLMHADVRHEQHLLSDVDGDGQPELLGACTRCTPNRTMGYFRRSSSDPTKEWTYHAVTKQYEFPYNGTGMLHGLGVGDVNGDGTPDLLERQGLWLDILAPTPNEQPCPGASCGHVAMLLHTGGSEPAAGGSHMFAFDVDGDGDPDIVSADRAHGYGISWYEQTAPLTFTKRKFLGEPIGPSSGAAFSQPHALEAADMDGDGTADIVTGKTFLANVHGFGDPDSAGKPVVYVFRTVRDMPDPQNGGSVTFEPHLVDETVGVGRQVAVGHLNDDGILDLCLASKLGLTVFLGK